MAGYPSKPCPVCRNTEVVTFFELRGVPIHCNVLHSSREQAICAPSGDMQLGFCRTCGMIYNLGFDPSRMRYDVEYENSLQYSPAFRDYLRRLSRRLVDQYRLTGKNIVEIGCGDGYFLRLLCQLGGNRGWGFDPAYNGEEQSPQPDSVRFIRDYYRASLVPQPVNMVVCRHVLEHVLQPRKMLGEVRKTPIKGNGTAVFFEVPDARHTFLAGGIWDILYEHCSYFTPSSLWRAFREEGFHISRIGSAFSGHYLQIEAEAANDSAPESTPAENNVSELASAVGRFAQDFHDKVAYWTRKIDTFQQARRQVVLWGAGTKGVSFLNMLKISERIRYVVDVSPRKTGCFISCTGQEIVSPSRLQSLRPDLVILMNAAYEAEIRQMMCQLRVDAEIVLA